eukprot:scaffold141508_cov14-Prasinocladus_malaysianus.AAC.1
MSAGAAPSAALVLMLVRIRRVCQKRQYSYSYSDYYLYGSQRHLGTLLQTSDVRNRRRHAR